jgi:hypothetical protein
VASICSGTSIEELARHRVHFYDPLAPGNLKQGIALHAREGHIGGNHHQHNLALFNNRVEVVEWNPALFRTKQVTFPSIVKILLSQAQGELFLEWSSHITNTVIPRISLVPNSILSDDNRVGIGGVASY